MGGWSEKASQTGRHFSKPRGGRGVILLLLGDACPHRGAETALGLASGGAGRIQHSRAGYCWESGWSWAGELGPGRQSAGSSS